MKLLKKLLGNNSKIDIDEIAMRQGNVVKLLSEAVIVESGSNANGNYVKFGNGWQICWGTLTVEDNKTINLPIAFKDTESSVFTSNPTTRNPNTDRSTQISGAIALEGSGLYLRLYNQNIPVSELEIMYVAVGLAK